MIPFCLGMQAMIKLMIVKRKHFLLGMLIGLSLAILFCTALLYPPSREVFGRIFESVEQKLMKQNSLLEGALAKILPEEDTKLYELSGRYIEKTLEVKAEPPDKAVREGTLLNFQILQDDSGYRRVIYTPHWKDAFYRGWLYLPNKIIQARHRLFIYPIGGSANYDFAGELGFEENVPLDNHRNINFLVFDFKVQNVKRYRNQLLLVGNPARSGFQIVSVVQDDILDPDEMENVFLVQLVTSGGYELDYDYTRIMQFDYRMEQIRENSVQSTSVPAVEVTLDALMKHNLKLQKELSFYIPVVESNYDPDNVMTKELCKPLPPSFPLEEKPIRDMRIEGQDIQIKIIYEDATYQRPVYDPAWKEHYKKYWAYVPSQICLNFNHLFVLPKEPDEVKMLLGMLSFSESNVNLKKNETGFLIYEFHVDHCIAFHRQLLFVGTPQRTGVSYITIDNRNLNEYTHYLARIITPDNEEIDYSMVEINKK
jgi:hypothetical protein